MTRDELVENLADAEHASWARWQEYLHSRCVENPDGSLTIPFNYVRLWKKEIETPYADLPDEQKKSDRDEVAHILPFIDEYAKTKAD